jgi:hypothetical protein
MSSEQRREDRGSRIEDRGGACFAALKSLLAAGKIGRKERRHFQHRIGYQIPRLLY